MTRDEAIESLKTEKEIIALNEGAYLLYLLIGLDLAYQGIPVAKVTKGYDND